MSDAINSLEAGIAANPYDESNYLTLIPLIKVDTGSNFPFLHVIAFYLTILFTLQTVQLCIGKHILSISTLGCRSGWTGWLILPALDCSRKRFPAALTLNWQISTSNLHSH